MDYAVDANVFIEARRRYYSFGICPGFWQSLLYHHTQNRIFSIDRVRDELTGKGDDLSNWAADAALDGCFESTDSQEIAESYAELVAWVYAQQQFTPAAKAEFAQKADAWLIAYARTSGKILVTHEVLIVGVKRKVPIPNVCEVFDVDYVDTFEMLDELGTSFHWNQPPDAA